MDRRGRGGAHQGGRGRGGAHSPAAVGGGFAHGSSPGGGGAAARGGHGPTPTRAIPLPGPSLRERVQWIRERATRACLPPSEDRHYGQAQFLYELWRRSEPPGEALKACFEGVSQAGGERLLEALLPALALPEVLDALPKEHPNAIYMLVLSPPTLPAWLALVERLHGMHPPERAELLLQLCTVCAHALDICNGENYWVLPGALGSLLADAAQGHEGPGPRAAQLLRDRLNHAAARRREAVKVVASGLLPARVRASPLSSDEDLEALGVAFRSLPVLPIREDIFSDAVVEGGAQQQDVFPAAAAGGGAAPAPRAADPRAAGTSRFLHFPVVPYNRARGAFPSLNAYLATHFNLLREDALVTMREALCALREAVEAEGGGATPPTQRGGCRILTGVKAVGVTFGRRRVGWRVRFDRPRNLPPSALLSGSLLCLVAEEDLKFERLVFATVSQQSDGEHKKLLQDTAGPFIDIEGVLDDSLGSEVGGVGLGEGWGGLPAAGSGGGDAGAGVRRVRCAALEEGCTYTMVESSTYFEAYRPVLAALQTIPEDPTRMPFLSELLGGAAGEAPPYLTGRPLHMTSAFKTFPGETLASVTGDWPVFESGLNASQLDAVKLALRSRVALIQGPPGCGKTHVGVRLTQLLLAASPARPLLFVCYTNHALDQLLTHVAEFEKRVVRVGARSKSQALQELSLAKWSDRFKEMGVDERLWKSAGNAQYHARNGLNEAKKRAEESFAAAAAYGSELLESDLQSLSVLVPWAAPGVESLLKRRHLLTLGEERLKRRLAEAQEPDGFEITRDERRRLLAAARRASFPDLVARFLHDRAYGKPPEAAPVEEGDDEGGGGGGGGSGGGGGESPELVQALRLAEALEAVDAVRAQQGEEIATRAVFVDPRAVNAGRVQRARAGDQAPRAAAAVAEAAGEDVSEDDIDETPSGGRARARARLLPQHQQVLSQQQLIACSESGEDVWGLSLRNRRALVTLWQEKRVEAAAARLTKAREDYAAQADELALCNKAKDSMLLRSARVIGLTTTCASKHRQLLEDVGPLVLVVEEAAEVLEAHILAAMVPSLQHVVLIGDHQQLRPKVGSFALDRHHALSVSMFERLINNGLPHAVLDTQHRMRPEFAALLTPTIYERLLSHPTTQDRPPVSGMQRSLFFLTHSAPESSSQSGTGFINDHEARMVGCLLDYLLRNGHAPEGVVVLVAYQSQATRVRAELQLRISSQGTGAGVGAAAAAPAASGGEEKRGGYAAVRVSTIDNFQGEEADIVLLSLVRSAPTPSKRFSGFMREANRVCVALSRARSGMYILGNGQLHRESVKLWEDMISRLESAGAYGPALPLACQRHPETITHVGKPLDFAGLAGGGCHLPCGARLHCGHACPQTCHPQQEHEDYRCTKACTREPHSACGHKACKLQCWQPCGDCPELVQRRILCCSLGHNATVPCGAPQPAACPATMVKPVPSCAKGHSAPVACGDAPPAACPTPCHAPLECGHQCQGTCGACSSAPGGEHQPCRQPCKRVSLCGHECRGGHACSDRCPPCALQCKTRCEHSRCTRTCAEPCQDCVEPCKLHCPHTKCTLLCHEPCNRPRCSEPCPRQRECSKCMIKRPCLGLCGEPCPTLCQECDGGERDPLSQATLREVVSEGDRIVQLECGHFAGIEYLDGYMEEQDVGGGGGGGNAEGGVGGAAAGGGGGGSSSGGSAAAEDAPPPRVIALPKCPACRSPIRRSFRYADIVRRAIVQVEHVKEMARAGAGLRGLILGALDLRKGKDVKAGLGQIKDSIARFPRSVTAHVVQGQLHMARAAVAPEDAPSQRALARGSFEDALRLLGLEDNGAPLKPHSDPTAQPRLPPQHAKNEAFLALRGLGFLLLREEGMAEAARVRLQAAKQLAVPGKDDDLDIEAVMADVTRVEREAVARTMEAARGRDVTAWYTCPKDHVYGVGNCGAGMETSKCPECSETIGGLDHQMAAGNAALGGLSSFHQAEHDNAHLVERMLRGEE